MANLKSFNSIAKKQGLRLIQGNGYLYWIAIESNSMVERKLGLLKTTSVWVNKFKDLTLDQWKEELKSIQDQMDKEDDYDPNEINTQFKIFQLNK